MLLDEMKSEPIPNYGEVMTLRAFIRCVNIGFFTDCDGHGRYATKRVMFSDQTISPSDVSKKVVDLRFTHVVWFNK